MPSASVFSVGEEGSRAVGGAVLVVVSNVCGDRLLLERSVSATALAISSTI